MDSDSVAIKIKASKQPGEVADLYEEAWDLIAATIRKNTKHRSAREILDGYLDETKEDGQGASTAKEICFLFTSPSSACDVQMAVTVHWFTLAIALAAKELAALCRAHGYEMKAPPQSARDLAKAERKVPFVPNGGAIVGVQRKKVPRVLADGGVEDTLEDAELSKATEKLVLAAAKTGRCACVMCETIRGGKAVVPKPKAKAKPARPAKPAAPGKLPKTELFTSVAKAMKSPERCDALEVQDKGVESLPEDFGKLQRLARLDLRGNPLTRLPASLFTITTLEHLSLPGGITEIPEALGDLVNLKFLALRGTAPIPDSLAKLENLEGLSLAGSNRTAVPEVVTRLPRLRRLMLSEMLALTAPLPDLGALTELTFLDLSRTKLSEGALDAVDFSKLTKLQELRLNSTKLPRFPATLRDLPTLAKLDLEYTKLTELPASFATLTGLVELNLRGCGLTTWPEALNDLPALKELYLHDAKLTSVDALRSFPALETLTFGATTLRSLPAKAPHLPALKRLYLNWVVLGKLPEWLFTSFPALECLSLYRTHLEPGEIERLKERRPGLEIRV
jgi:Leucine-rich repeat (LRR) protein